MMHIAIRIPPETSIQAIVSSINNWNSGSGLEGKPLTHPDYLIASMSQDELKARISVRIQTRPDEQWLILSGNTIAESRPAIRFRSV